MNCSSTSETTKRQNVTDGGLGQHIDEKMHWRTLLLQKWLEKPKRMSETNTKSKRC